MANNLIRADNRRNMQRLSPLSNIEDFFRELSSVPSMRGWDADSAIRLDISEDEKNYLVKADLPGVKKDDIKVSVDGNQITVSAEIKEEKDERNKDILRSERYVGQHYRSFTLPSEVDDAKAQATYKDGVLHLTLPKKSGAGRKQISIS